MPRSAQDRCQQIGQLTLAEEKGLRRVKIPIMAHRTKPFLMGWLVCWGTGLGLAASGDPDFDIRKSNWHENPEALKRVREHTDVPLAIGERYHNKWDCREAVINQWADYLRPDVCHCGGITEMMRIAALAHVFYITLIPHNNAGPLGTAATLHAALAIPNVALIEAPWVNSEAKPGVVWPYPKVEKGYALPLEGPGLGITFDEKLARSVPFRQPAMQPRLNDPDGSVRDF